MRRAPEAQAGPSEGRWRGRPLLGACIRAVVVIGPVAIALGASLSYALLVPRPDGVVPTSIWWVVMLTISTVVVISTERVFHRLTPLATLFKLTMLFPDRAPSRFRMARRAGRTSELEARISEARERGVPDDSSEAAETILSLVTMLNNHDKRTRGHSERVRVYADLIAEEMKVPTEGRDRLQWSALLHDIGKLSVSSDMLNDPGKPGKEEWKRLRQHPVAGAKLAAPLMPWLGEWGRAIPEHHERVDGTGYPKGLSGKQISLAARIVAVADAYETIIAGRPYKEALSPEAARHEVAEGAGTAYDPAVCRALMGLSLGRLKRVSGGLVWLAHLPAMLGFDRLSQVASAAVQTAGSAAIAVVGTAGIVVSGVVPGLRADTGVARSDDHVVVTTPIDQEDAPSTPVPVVEDDAPVPSSSAPSNLGEALATTPLPVSVPLPTPAPLLSKLPSATVTPVDCPEPETLQASADTYVTQATPDGNHGDDTELLVGAGVGTIARTLIRFDLPSSQGCTVASADLLLWVDLPQGARTIEARRLAGGWAEGSVTWNSQPSASAPVASATNDRGWAEWDVTPLVRAGARNGFLLKDAAESSGLEMQTLSGRLAAHKPKLMVSWEPA